MSGEAGIPFAGWDNGHPAVFPSDSEPRADAPTDPLVGLAGAAGAGRHPRCQSDAHHHRGCLIGPNDQNRTNPKRRFARTGQPQCGSNWGTVPTECP